MSDSSVIGWILVHAAGGLVAFGFPRLVIAIGVPYDRWIITMGERVKVHLNRQVVIWAMTILLGFIFYAISVALSKDHSWDPQVPQALAEAWQMVRPLHLIMFGLAFAVSGAVWMAAAPSPKPSKTMKQLPTPANGAKPLPKMFTAYDVEQRLRAIDELYGLLGSRVMSVSAAGERLNKSLEEKILSKTAASDLTAHADATEAALNNYFETAGRYMIFSDIHHDATALVWNPFEIVSSARNLAAEIKSLEQQNANVILYLKNNKFLADFKSGTSGRFWTWINKKEQLLTNKRREYEAASVYPK